MVEEFVVFTRIHKLQALDRVSLLFPALISPDLYYVRKSGRLSKVHEIRSRCPWTVT